MAQLNDSDAALLVVAERCRADGYDPLGGLEPDQPVGPFSFVHQGFPSITNGPVSTDAFHRLQQFEIMNDELLAVVANMKGQLDFRLYILQNIQVHQEVLNQHGLDILLKYFKINVSATDLHDRLEYEYPDVDQLLERQRERRDPTQSLRDNILQEHALMKTLLDRYDICNQRHAPAVATRAERGLPATIDEWWGLSSPPPGRPSSNVPLSLKDGREVYVEVPDNMQPISRQELLVEYNFTQRCGEQDCESLWWEEQHALGQARWHLIEGYYCRATYQPLFDGDQANDLDNIIPPTELQHYVWPFPEEDHSEPPANPDTQEDSKPAAVPGTKCPEEDHSEPPANPDTQEDSKPAAVPGTKRPEEDHSEPPANPDTQDDAVVAGTKRRCCLWCSPRH